MILATRVRKNYSREYCKECDTINIEAMKMTRRNKTEKMQTPEEKLREALVPESEQPYRIPDNWCWTTLNSVSEVITGSTPSKKHPEYYGGEFPFFKPADLDSGRSVFEASEYASSRI